jgi:hypothetical protein
MALGMASRTTRVAVSRSAAVRPMVARRAQAQRCVVVRAYQEYPDPDFMRATKEAFPDKGIATAEEARCLIDFGYIYLDVRPALEIEEVGKWKVRAGDCDCWSFGGGMVTGPEDARRPLRVRLGHGQAHHQQHPAELLMTCMGRPQRIGAPCAPLELQQRAACRAACTLRYVARVIACA